LEDARASAAAWANGQPAWRRFSLQGGERQGELNAYRKVLRKALEKRFGPLPEEVSQRIETAELPALEAAFDQADAIQSLDGLVF
jgi:hypothetical protein